ncbi:MAG: hypothetical protein KF777_15150 [Planctomycetaceae bacterium]|nr:hypothetical protein [Planctomycetaceae bacterium]
MSQPIPTTDPSPSPDLSASSSSRWDEPHSVEYQVQRALANQESVRIDGLRVHRTPAGVCVEGCLEAGDEQTVRDLLKSVCGTLEVSDRLYRRGECTLSPGVPLRPR